MSTTTRHIGFCPCCAKDFKVRSNELVHHGYKRPGHGFIVGDCMGALRTPHELSPELAKDYRRLICNALKATLKAVVNHSVATELTVSKRNYRTREDESYTITPEHHEWNWTFTSRERNLQRKAKDLLVELDRITELVDTWELKALTTVEEEQAAKRDATAVREAKKVQAKHDKVLAQAAKYQKRIDSALKTKNSNTLAEIWESCQFKLLEIDHSLTKAECLTLLERDNVWAAFGLTGLTLSPWRAESKPEDAVLRLMKCRMDRIKGYTYLNSGRDDEWTQKRLAELSLEWPQELGGENKKGAKTLAEIREH